VGVRPLKGRGVVGPRSIVEEGWRAHPADVVYRARSSLTRLVDTAARKHLMARGFFIAKLWTKMPLLFSGDGE
jgi:hypothetical protein